MPRLMLQDNDGEEFELAEGIACALEDKHQDELFEQARDDELVSNLRAKGLL